MAGELGAGELGAGELGLVLVGRHRVLGRDGQIVHRNAPVAQGQGASAGNGRQRTETTCS